MPQLTPQPNFRNLAARECDSCYRAERESDVGAGRRLGSEWHNGCRGSVDGSNRSVGQSVAFRKKGHQGLGGIPTDSQDTLLFAKMIGMRPMIEKYPISKAAEGSAHMTSGKVEFRVVLTM